MNQYFPWVPEWLDLNIVVPIGATIVVIIVGVIVVCVALSRRSRGPEQTRLRGKIKVSLLQLGIKFIYEECPESKCTEALTAGGIFFLICCLHCHVA